MMKKNEDEVYKPCYVGLYDKLSAYFGEEALEFNVYGEFIVISFSHAEEIQIYLYKEMLVIVLFRNIIRKPMKTNSWYKLNELNSEREFTTHTINVQNSIYTCRCIIPYDQFLGCTKEILDYAREQHKQGKEMLKL